MILHCRDGIRGRVLDLDTGRHVPKVIWLDTAAGILEAYEVDGNGNERRDNEGNYLTYRARGNFRWEPRNGAVRPDTNRLRRQVGASPVSKGILLGAPTCVRCRSVLTLPGDDLCPRCRAADRGQRQRFIVERLTTPLLDHPCQHPGCGRLANFSVGDEVVVSPEVGQRKLMLPDGRTFTPYYTRGMMVERRWYCSRHYEPPRILDACGEVVKVDEEAGGVRPQW